MFLLGWRKRMRKKRQNLGMMDAEYQEVLERKKMMEKLVALLSMASVQQLREIRVFVENYI